ncbi:unnamed protein product [Hyaloperonospora brassicae]|uniref:Uncharacterized protein n=1 Tax=Hyaloperonospora brassicae TaxID=162125 RepID=A0AAV0SX98_HYABA|nr:unnamed protein product [Hyaloperonospora brassicae]
MSRKREWIERRHSITEESDSSMSPDPDETNRSEGGEVIESEMKRLRVAYNYDGAHGVRRAGEAVTLAPDVEIPRARAVRSDYADINFLLREFHYLRQLRKFQAERRRV